MKSKPQCSTKLCKLLIMCNKSIHHERRIYVEVWRNLIKCVLNGPSLCCSSFSVKMPRGSWRQEEGFGGRMQSRWRGPRKQTYRNSKISISLSSVQTESDQSFGQDDIQYFPWPISVPAIWKRENRRHERVRLTLLAHNLVFLYSSTPLRCW